MMKFSAGIVLSVLALAACGESGPEAYTLTISGDALEYAAAQDGDGAWQQLTLDASGTATFEVTRGYHGVVARCGRYVSVRFDTAPGPWGTCTSSPSTTIEVSGSLVPATATAWLGNSISWQTDGTYSVESGPGRRDLVATADDRVLLRRDLQLTADQTIDLDVTADGVALETIAPTVTGNGSTPFTPFTEIVTANGTYVRTSSTTFGVVPTALRVAGDRIAIGADMRDGDVSQVVQREVIGDAVPALAFEPNPMLAADRTSLRWGDGWDFTAISLMSPAFDDPSVHTMITSDWMAASGATSVPLVDSAALPGWDPAWGQTIPDAVLRGLAWAGIGDIAGDYRASFVDVTW